jgi:hypothetical protein
MRTPLLKGFSLFFRLGVNPPVVFEAPTTSLDDELLERLAAEAEAGYDPDKLKARPTRNLTRTYHVELWRQPLHHWLHARLYHLYDTWIWRLPGYRLLERVHRRRYHRGDEDMYVPLAATQDIRCYELRVRHRQVIATFEVDKATYEQLGGRERPRSPTAEARS